MKPLNINQLERPRLRSGVSVVAGDDGVELVYRGDDGCLLEGDPAVLTGLCASLVEGGATTEELARVHVEVADDLEDLLVELDRLGLLTDSALPAPVGVMTGRQFARELHRLTDRVSGRCAGETGQGPLHWAMSDGSVTANHLVGYVLEYYQLVRFAPRILAPALAKHEPPEVEDALLAFYVSEMHHDRMLERALAAVGISRAELRASQPLPSTHALCVSLGAYASQDPLTFKSSLYLFEEASPTFNEAFAVACQQVGLPDDFIAPILGHARLNDDEGHGDITSTLLSWIPGVSAEERRLTTMKVAVLVETFFRAEQEMYDYYGRADARIPRLFG